MPRASTSTTIDPALDAAALLRRIGFFGLFVVLPVLAQVARRASVILAPIAVILLIIASVIDRRQRPVRPATYRLLTAPAFLAGMLVILWSALSLTWTPFLGPAWSVWPIWAPRSASPSSAISRSQTGCVRRISTSCPSASWQAGSWRSCSGCSAPTWRVRCRG